jgi:hypothetical protein
MALALVAAACGSSPPPASVAPAPTSTWDPRRDEIDHAAAIWAAEQPATYAYTSTMTVDGMGMAATHVSGIDGHVEQLARVTSSSVSSDALTVEAGFEAARAGLARDDTITVDIDQRYGYLASLGLATDVPDGGSTRTVTEFTTPGDRAASGRAQDALSLLLDRWAGLSTPAWEYTWTRVEASSPGTPTGWVVRRVDGSTTAVAAGSSNEVSPPASITIDGTVAEAVGVVAAGGWVDVAVDDLTGLDVLMAVDPSPAVKGDGYWIRIDFTDRAAARQRELLDAATVRWAAAKLKKHSYTWAYDGQSGAWSIAVSATGDVLKLGKRSAGAPTGDGFEIRPAVADAFTAIDEILAAGGTVTVTYDKALGYPRKIVITNGGAVAGKGTITISRFKSR